MNRAAQLGFRHRRSTAWGQSLSPGNEQRDFWGSQAADQAGSRNSVGIKNPAVDALIERVIFAKDRDELVAATKALDRVLLWNHFVVPQWTYGKMRTARWDRFGRPESCPNTASAFPTIWWWDADTRRQDGTRSADLSRRERPRSRRDVLAVAPAHSRCRVGAAARAADETETHGISAFGDLKYPADFRHFDYVDGDAPKGGLFSQIGPTASSIRTSSPSIRSTATSSRATPRRAWSSPSPR